MADSNPDDKKVTKVVDKLVMGLIIGGAVGSVLGVAFAPKAGKDTRKILKKKVGEISEEVKEKTGEMREKATELKEDFMEEHGEEVQEAKEFVVKKSRGIFGFFRDAFGPKKIVKKVQKSARRIPSERD